MTDDSRRWQRRYERERAARLEAERIAELAIADLYTANQDLDRRVVERTTELEHALQGMEAARRAEATFLHGLAHELSTPLHAIIGLVELVRERTADAEIRACADEIGLSADRLHQALRTLIEFAALSGSDVAVEASEVLLDDLAERVSRRWRRRAAKHGMLLVVEVDPSASSTVITDPERVAQIVDPLVDNAVCHGGGRLQVHFDVDPAVDADQPVMRIRVADEGPGISPELHDEVFDPFVRGSPSVSGFGVGLALARAVAQALGGRLELVASDSGAVFEAQVPIEIGSHQAAANSAGPGMGAGTPRR